MSASIRYGPKSVPGVSTAVEAGVAEGAERVGHERRGVEPALNLLCRGPIAGQFRVADQIGPLAAGSAAGVVDAADNRERQPTLHGVDAGQRPASQQAVGGGMPKGARD